MTSATADQLRQTVRVGLDRIPEWGAHGLFVGFDGPTIERGIDVLHEAANIPCGQYLRMRRDPDNGAEYAVHCKKRVGHALPKDEAPHVPEDARITAVPTRVVHGRRFAPNGIPAGVNQLITAPHDCANHLKDVEDVARGF